MRSDAVGSALDTHCLRLIGCLAALVMASEAGAGALFSPATFQVGSGPESVAVADLDGDSVPDLVTANFDNDEVSVLLGNGDGTFQAWEDGRTYEKPTFVARQRWRDSCVAIGLAAPSTHIASA